MTGRPLYLAAALLLFVTGHTFHDDGLTVATLTSDDACLHTFESGGECGVHLLQARQKSGASVQLESWKRHLAEQQKAQRLHNFTRPGTRPVQSIALLVAVSTRNAKISGVSELDFFKELLPSFLNTTGKDDGFRYVIYAAFDVGDPFYDSAKHRAEFEHLLLTRAGARAKLRWVNVAPYLDGQHGPVRAWNLAFQEAFSDGMDYFYQLGEDIKLISPSWASLFTKQLEKQDDFGIVGGKEVNFQSKTGFLPCVLVSRTHMHIFGTLYPTTLHNWWSDEWMMKIYRPFNLTTQLPDVHIANTHDQSRYTVSQSDHNLLEELVNVSSDAITQYRQLLGVKAIVTS